MVEAARVFSELDAVLDRFSGASATCLTDNELLDDMRGLERLRRRVEAAGQQRLLELDRRGVAQQAAAPDTARMLSELVRITPKEARQRVKDATDLGSRTGLSGQSAPPLFPQLAALHRAAPGSNLRRR